LLTALFKNAKEVFAVKNFLQTILLRINKPQKLPLRK